MRHSLYYCTHLWPSIVNTELAELMVRVLLHHPVPIERSQRMDCLK